MRIRDFEQEDRYYSDIFVYRPEYGHNIFLRFLVMNTVLRTHELHQ